MVEHLQRVRAAFHFFLHSLDLPLLVALCLLMLASLAVLHSVEGPVQAQAMRFAAGLAAMWGLSLLAGFGLVMAVQGRQPIHGRQRHGPLTAGT